MDKKNITLWGLTIKTIVVHTVTYSVIGFLAFTFLNYTATFASGEWAKIMRPTDHPLVMAGPLFQILRGLIFGLAFYPLRTILFEKKNGWLVLWWTLVAIGILSTFGAAPGSIEGMVYTVIPIGEQIRGYIEIVTQAFLLSIILYYWVTNPQKKWLGWVLWICFVLFLIFPILGLLVA